VLLAGVAAALLVTEIVFFSQYILAGQLSDNIVVLLDRILLIIIFAEVLYGAGFFSPTLASAWRLLGRGTDRGNSTDSCSHGRTAKDGQRKPSDFLQCHDRAGLLTLLIVALVVSLRLIRPKRSKCRGGGQSTSQTKRGA